MAGELQTWTSPEAKGLNNLIKYAVIAGVGLFGLYTFINISDPVIKAITLLNTIFQDGTHMLVSGGIFLGALFLFYETFSPSGQINKLLLLPWWMFINGMTRLLITTDPLSVFDERIKQVQADKESFENQFERIDGIVSRIQLKEQDCEAKRDAAQRRGVAANKQGNKMVVDVSAHDYGAYSQAAQRYKQMENSLLPMRATLQQVAQACDATVQKLTTERSILADQWNLGQAMHGVTTAASRILRRSRSQIWNMADQAAEIIQNKYGDELGHLDHLKRFAEPMLQSIDVDNATFSDQMLSEVNDAGTKMLQATNATPLPLPAPGVGARIPDPSIAGMFQP